VPPQNDDDRAVSTSARENDAAAAGGSTPEGNGSATDAPRGDEQAPRRRPTGLLVLCGVLALAAIGLGIWALSAQSNADDTQAKLDAATKAAAANQAEPTPTPTPQATPAQSDTTATVTLDPETQQLLDDYTAAIGATNENLDEIQADLQKASKSADEARQEKADASNALERAQADVAGFKADAQLAGACLRGTLEALKTAFANGGTEAVVE